MNKRKYILAFVLMSLTAMTSVEAWGQGTGRIARVKQGNFLYSNWDAPHLTLDTCLDMTLTQITVPDIVECNGRKYPVVEIGPGAFRGCKNLAYIEFGYNMSGFLKGSLLDCPNLRVIKINRSEPPHLNNIDHPFYGCTWDEIIEPYHTLSTVIVVPEGCEEAYRNAPGWKEFKMIQSHMPDGKEINMDEIDARINQLESELEKAQQVVDKIKQEIDVLHKTKELQSTQ